MNISKKEVIPLSDFALQKNFEDENSAGLSTVRKDVKKSLGNQEEIEKRGKKSVKKENVTCMPGSEVKKNLSAYEQMIQKNREEKMAFLQSINIEEAKINLSKAVDSKKKKPAKRKPKVLTSPPVKRKSKRLANIDADINNDVSYLQALKVIAKRDAVVKKSKNYKCQYLRAFVLKNKAIPPEMSFKDVLHNLYESYIADICILESKCNAKSITYDKSDLEKMTVAESNIFTITPDRISSLTWYPSSEELIVAAGDLQGNIGIKKVNNESNPYLMGIHFKAITNLQFNPFNPVQLISSGNDGILRCGDMVQHRFNEIYRVSENHTYSITCFDIFSENIFLVAERNKNLLRQVVLVDSRTKRCFEKHDYHHNFTIKALNIHPVNRNFFVSADSKGYMRIWDLRSLQNNPLSETNCHKQTVRAAYFSPVTGNSILATSADNTVSIYDTFNLSKIELKQRKKYDMLPAFSRATWLPNSEEFFVIGSKDYPCKIEVCDKNMCPYSIIMNENLTSITYLNVFHPRRLALASAHSSGKLSIFT